MKKERKGYVVSEWDDGWFDVDNTVYENIEDAKEYANRYASHHGIKPENVAVWEDVFDAYDVLVSSECICYAEGRDK